jgi:hypothetical protein
LSSMVSSMLSSWNPNMSGANIGAFTMLLCFGLNISILWSLESFRIFFCDEPIKEAKIFFFYRNI